MTIVKSNIEFYSTVHCSTKNTVETHHLEKLKIRLKSHHWSHSLDFTHLYFVDYVRKVYLAADAEVKPTACHLCDGNNIIFDNSAIFKKVSEKMMSSCVSIPFWMLSSVVVRHHIPQG